MILGLPEQAITRAEVVAPLREAVSFVDDEEFRKNALRLQLGRQALETLRRNVQQRQAIIRDRFSTKCSGEKRTDYSSIRNSRVGE